MLRTSGTDSPQGIARQPQAAWQNRLRFFLTRAKLGTGKRIGFRIGFRTCAHCFDQRSLLCCKRYACAAVTAIDRWLRRFHVVEVLVAVPASADFSPLRHIVVLVGVLFDWRQFTRWEVVTDRLERLLKRKLVCCLTRH